MDAMQEARVAEINAALRKRGADEVRGDDRRKLVTELTELLTGPAATEPEIAPEKRGRLAEIDGRLQRHERAANPADFITAEERHALIREKSDILLGVGVAPPPPEAA